MIYTITPNPALDLGGMVEQLIPNEKSYVKDETRFPGGNAINAARLIKKLGQPVIASGFLGGGIGQEIEELLHNEGVRTQFIKIRGHTRVSVTVSNRKTHLQTRFSFPGPRIEPKESQQLLRSIQKIDTPALIIIGGSLPSGFSVQDLRQLMQIANSREIPCVVDVPGPILKKIISSKPLMIKPNLVEFQELLGEEVTSIPEVTKAARKLIKYIPLICISSVENGALLVTAKRVWHGRIPPVKVKTTVGAGDSMVGAMSAQLWKGKTMKMLEKGDELLRWGLAAATSTLITTGTQLGELNEILRYYPKVMIREISGA